MINSDSSKVAGSISIKQDNRSFAIVTPTYLPDLARCELLAESLDHVAPDVPHYLIVDRRDRQAFLHLKYGKRQIIESEAILGKWILRMPGRRGLWFSLHAPPIRGWIIQQILKIGAIEHIAERTLVFCDSDTAFFRRFDRNDLLVDGKIGLLDVDFRNEINLRWAATARRLLGIAANSETHRNHVGNMICWNREIIIEMQKRIEATTGLKWQIALARTHSFAEYMLYGIFVREWLGYDNVDHAPSTVPLVKPSWGVALATDSAIEDFFSNFDSRTVAVMIHSKDNVDPKCYRSYLERLWNKMNKNN